MSGEAERPGRFSEMCSSRAGCKVLGVIVFLFMAGVVFIVIAACTTPSPDSPLMIVAYVCLGLGFAVVIISIAAIRW